MGLIDRPDAASEPMRDRLWSTFDGMFHVCHETVRSGRVGDAMCTEAMRTDVATAARKPLAPYRNRSKLRGYARPWQQMLMFFARTYGGAARHPEYTFTERQRGAWKTLVDACTGEEEEEEPHRPDTLSPAQSACLKFCVTLLDDEFDASEYSTPLVCASSLLGLNQTGWLEINAYTSILSNLIKISRLMVIQTAYRHVRKKVRRLQDMMKDFMVRGSLSPMQWFLDLRAYGMSIAKHQTSEGRVEWNGDDVLMGAIRLAMQDLRATVHGLVAKAREVLSTELVFVNGREEMLSVPWGSLADDPTNKQAGWCFLLDGRTVWPCGGEGWLPEHIERRPRIRKRFFTGGDSPVPNTASCRSWLHGLNVFLDKLLVLVHLTGGQPPRGPEMLSAQFRNTSTGEQRHVFIYNGTVAFVLRYHKGYATARSEKMIF